MANEAKRKLTNSERERYLQIKVRMMELFEEDGKLRAELAAMGLKFERKWWHGPSSTAKQLGRQRSRAPLDWGSLRILKSDGNCGVCWLILEGGRRRPRLLRRDPRHL